MWDREHQWEPLWDDVARKFTEYLEGRKDAPVHFLGAMVLEQKQTPTTHVVKRQVIDGQQRLTTLQIFLAALRDFCRAHQCEDLARECDKFTLNKGMMADPDVDRFKVWPTQLDRQQFREVLTAGSAQALEALHPLKKQKYAKKFDPRPRMVESYFFYYSQLAEFFLGTSSEEPVAHEYPLGQRLEECFLALKAALQVVVIDLESGDDAQVIFETLNARGEPLLPADLLRNFIFLRAARQGEPQEELYKQYWSRFDDPFWRQEVKQGRLTRPRSDLYLQHFLASRRTDDIPIRHLFVEYKYWIDRTRPFDSIHSELATLARQGDDFRRIVEPKTGDVLFPLVTLLDRFDIRTAYPLLLHLLDHGLAEVQWKHVSSMLESYLLRRAVCGLSTKHYNLVFLRLTRYLRKEGTSPEQMGRYLAELKGESIEWPSDDAFADAWRSRHAYRTMNNPKIVHTLWRLSNSYLSQRNEALLWDGPLTVEHIMPQSWIEHWPLPDGSRGLAGRDLSGAEETDALRIATLARNEALQRLGNLTILTQSLNGSASNSPWTEKRQAILNSSLLPINQQLYAYDAWDESAIQHRSESLLARALEIWPRAAGELTGNRPTGSTAGVTAVAG